MDKHQDEFKKEPDAEKRPGQAVPKRPSEWFLYEIFLAVAQAGNFMEAERVTGYGFHYLSKLITKLEKTHDVRLFTRMNDGLSLTIAGKALFKSLQGMQAYAVKSTNILNWANKGGLKDVLTVGAPRELGDHLLGFMNKKIQKSHKEFLLELAVLDNLTVQDLTGFDCALYAGEIIFSNYESVYLYTEEACAYASESYVEKNGSPGSVKDLIHDHFALPLRNAEVKDENSEFLSYFYNQTKTQNFISNSPTTMLRDILHDEGIGMLDKSYELHYPIRRVLPQHSVRGRPVYLIYSKYNENHEKIKELKKMLLDFTKSLR
jgi:DNA-binding transcriptional LysR family regulator